MLIVFFERSTFVGSAWSFGFFIPATTANDLRLRRIFYARFYPLHLFSYLNSSERASISLLMLSAKQENYWYHFYNVFGMTRSLSGGIEPDHAYIKSLSMDPVIVLLIKSSIVYFVL